MSDEQQRRGDAARAGSEPDETRQFDASADDQNQPDGGPRSGDAGIVDRTEQLPRTEVADAAGGDETVVSRRPDATSIMPAAEQDAGRSGDADRAAGSAWLGRAEVRPPRPGQGGDFTTGDWDPTPPQREPQGKWWTPIVVGIVVLVLLALLGWGVWLIVQASQKGDNGSPAPATTSAAAPEQTGPTTTPPTTQTTTTPATTEPTGPKEVTVPALKGLSSAEARQALDRTGLAYRLRFVTSADAPAGTVIDSDPAEGQQVPSDTTVTLIIAAAPSSPATPTTTPTTTPPTDTNGQPGDN
jgi:hypothetical protein